MLRIGLNPYGLTYTVGLQGLGTPRANPRPAGLDGFIALGFEIGVRAIEIDSRWLLPLGEGQLADLRARFADRGVVPVCSHGMAQTPGETLAEPIRRTRAIGGALLRMHATPVLEGARAGWGSRWTEMVDHTRRVLAAERQRSRDTGVMLAIEDHQDFGSEELVDIATEAGEHVGVVLDTGNPLSVAEDPVAFTHRVAPLVRHVHLKDYRAQTTAEGIRLVRCALGDGCIPFAEIARVLETEHATLTASIELAALEARHIRLFESDWWQGYPTRDADELATALQRLRPTEYGPDEDVRTPWERGAPPDEIVAYELNQLWRSVEYLRRLGWLPAAA